MNIRKIIHTTLFNILTENSYEPFFIYHGTHKGAALNIQRTGHMTLNNTGEERPSISFTKDIKYAKYYAQAKGSKDRMVILRIVFNNDDFILSPRISKNKGIEYITFNEVPSSKLEILTPDGTWRRLDSWNVIFDEPL